MVEGDIFTPELKNIERIARIRTARHDKRVRYLSEKTLW